jgi:hypothetical protein
MGNRVSYYEGSADVEKEVTKYVQNQCGDMAVAGGSFYPLPSLAAAVHFWMLTDLHPVYAGPRTYNAVHQVVRPHAGHHLQLVTLDLGPCHTWPGNHHRPESGASTTLATIPEEQPMRPIEPRSQTLAAWRTGSRPSPTWRHANPIPEELEAHRTGNPSTNHGR